MHLRFDDDDVVVEEKQQVECHRVEKMSNHIRFDGETENSTSKYGPNTEYSDEMYTEEEEYQVEGELNHNPYEWKRPYYVLSKPKALTLWIERHPLVDDVMQLKNGNLIAFQTLQFCPETFTPVLSEYLAGAIDTIDQEIVKIKPLDIRQWSYDAWIPLTSYPTPDLCNIRLLAHKPHDQPFVAW